MWRTPLRLLGAFWHLLTTTRPSVLDSFALLSGQLNTLNKVLKHEKTPLFRNQVIIPLVLSPDRDEDLMVSGEERYNLGNEVLRWGPRAQLLVGYSRTSERGVVCSNKKWELPLEGLIFCPGVGELFPNKPEDYVTKAKTFLLEYLSHTKSMFFCDFVYFTVWLKKK